MAIARRVRVHGRVQGVFFRDSTREEAARLRVAGWVRNCADGTVEAWFEGDPSAVQELVVWCESGPPRAAVSQLEAEEVSPAGLSGFEIR